MMKTLKTNSKNANNKFEIKKRKLYEYPVGNQVNGLPPVLSHSICSQTIIVFHHSEAGTTIILLWYLYEAVIVGAQFFVLTTVGNMVFGNDS